MNILVIGNGFDLAHELPTTYQDFLRFTDHYTQYLDPKVCKQVWGIKRLVEKNTWLKHFKKLYNLNGWVGFESEISNVVQIMEKKILQFEVTKETGKGYITFNSEEEEIMSDFDSRIVYGRKYNIEIIKNNKERMLKDLNNLIKCLAIYLAYYVNPMKVHCLCSEMEYLDIQKVLSFNYTDTFARIYGIHEDNAIEYDYIHGKAEPDTIDTNNLVLGIDESLPDDRKNKDLEFIDFKKYYQRIYKNTGGRYKDWINAIKAENEKYMEKKRNCKSFLGNGYGSSNEIEERKKELEKLEKNPPWHNLYIFGHSLDITDGDVIRELILNDYVHTTIFYPDEEEYGRKIANLVKIIGQDELNKRTGGSTKTIEFILQGEWPGTIVMGAIIPDVPFDMRR